LNIEDCLAANNSGPGISVYNSGTARVSNSTVTDNGSGLYNSYSPPGILYSRGNNTVQGNGTNKSGGIASFTAD
jgi:parallel beta-helix repeat protein